MKWVKPLTFLVGCKHFLRWYYLFKLKTQTKWEEENYDIQIKPACCLLCSWNNGSSFYSYKIKCNLAFANETVFTVKSTNDNIKNYWCVNKNCSEIIILGVNVIILLQFKLKQNTTNFNNCLLIMMDLYACNCFVVNLNLTWNKIVLYCDTFVLGIL